MTQHASLSSGRWNTFPLSFQLANVGSDVGRALKAKEGQNESRLSAALDRMLELMDLTIADPKNRARLSELCRLREVLCDYFFGENTTQSTAKQIDQYFLAFGRSIT